jgi:uncharacterized protein with PIN domain
MGDPTAPTLGLVVPPALRVFLHRGRRPDPHTGLVTVRIGDPANTLGHVVQSAGVPLVEVGLLRADGVPLDPGRPAPRGVTVELAPRRRPQPAPADPPRFLLDVHLGSLARRMRLLGLDVAYRNDAADDELLAWSLDQRRVLLTRDHGLLRRRAVRWAGYVRGQRTDEQLADVLDRFAPPLRPWSRCLACNGELVPVEVTEVADRLQPGTLRSYVEFSRCTGCARVFWRGAHAGRLEKVIATAAVVSRAGPG